MKKWILISGLCVVLLIPVLGFRPVDSSRENCRDISGRVSEVYEAGTKDAVIKFSDGKSYYINRGLENHFTLTELRTKLVGKQVVVSYALNNALFGLYKYPTPHIAQLKVEGDIIYSEFKN